MRLLQLDLRRARPIPRPLVQAGGRCVARVAEHDRPRGPAVARVADDEHRHVMIDGAFQLILLPQRRYVRLGVGAPIHRERGGADRPGKARRRQRLHRLAGSGDHLIFQFARVVVDELLLLVVQEVHRPQVVSDDRPRVRMRAVENDRFSAELMCLLNPIAHAAGGFTVDAAQVERDEHGAPARGILQCQCLAPQVVQLPLGGAVARRVPAHPHRRRRRDHRPPDARLPLARRGRATSCHEL